MLQQRLWLRFYCVAGLLFAGCETTRLSTTWRDPNASAIAFKKVVVVVLNSSPGERRAQEDTLVGQIKRADAVAAYTFISDDQLKDAGLAKAKIIAGGFDSAILLRLVDTRDETTFVPGTTTVWDDGWGHRTYSHSGGYAVTETYLRAEISLHTVPEGRLLWSGVSETLNPTSARDFAAEVAQAAAAELRKQKLLQ